MNKILRSTWFLAILALALGIGTQAWVIHRRLQLLDAQTATVVPEEAKPQVISWSFLTPDIEAMQEELRARLAAVSEREKELQDYDLRLQAERAEVQKVKAEVERLREELSTTVTEVQVAEQKNLKKLATTYANLKPASAVAIFAEMDDDMVVKILAFMEPDPVGLILDEMTRTKDGGGGSGAGRAAAITNKLRLLRPTKAEDNS